MFIKKKKILIYLLLFSLILIGCENSSSNNSNNTNEETTNEETTNEETTDEETTNEETTDEETTNEETTNEIEVDNRKYNFRIKGECKLLDVKTSGVISQKNIYIVDKFDNNIFSFPILSQGGSGGYRFSTYSHYNAQLGEIINMNNYVGYNARIDCIYTKGDKLSQFIPLVKTDNWLDTNGDNVLYMRVSPVTDLHYQIYKEKLSNSSDASKALNGANNEMITYFPKSYFLPQRKFDTYNENIYEGYTNMFIGIASLRTGGNLSILNKMVAKEIEKPNEQKDEIIAVGLLSKSLSPLLTTKRGSFLENKVLSSWSDIRNYPNYATMSSNISYCSLEKEALAINLTSTRRSSQEAPYIGKQIIYDIPTNMNIYNILLLASYDKFLGREGKTALFSGTGLAGILIEYRNNQTDTTYGKTLLANFTDAGNLVEFPWLIAGPTTIRNTNKLHVVREKETINFGKVISLKDEINNHLKDVKENISDINQIRVSVIGTDLITLFDDRRETKCLDCQAEMLINSVNLYNPKINNIARVIEKN